MQRPPAHFRAALVLGMQPPRQPALSFVARRMAMPLGAPRRQHAYAAMAMAKDAHNPINASSTEDRAVFCCGVKS